jgi:streptomycin 6-kinase
VEAHPVQDLQARIHAHTRDWSVQVESIAETETSVLLSGHRAGQPIVLKVLRQPGDEWHSGAVLAAFEGRAVVRVYEHTGGALLLERLRPGSALVELVLAGQDGAATDILADVMGAMAPRSPPAPAPTVLDWAAGFDRYAATGDGQIPSDLLAHAHGLYLQLCHSQSRVRLLHGDLQHYNVLLDARRGWLAIDPKGVVGEPEFEIGAALRNPVERADLFAQPDIVARRLQRFADKLAIDRGRALSWGFAQAVLSAAWTVEDGLQPSSHNPGLLLAQAIRPMLLPVGRPAP